MAETKVFNVLPGTDINMIVNVAAQNLNAQGYDVYPMVMNPATATLVVKKNNDGFQNFIGLGIESRATLTMNGPSLYVSIESEWTNKILAIVLGWFFCLVPFITGIIGAVNQNSLPGKIESAVMVACSSNMGGGYGPNYGNVPPQGGYAPNYNNQNGNY